MKLFDSHCHLQDERLQDRLDSHMTAARNAGIQNWICCGSSPEDWADTLEISRRYPGVWPALGLHPWYVDTAPLDWLTQLGQMLETTGACIGEIGLDHALSPRNDKALADAFIAQLRLARDFGRPVSIHCRKAWGELVDILGREGGLPHGGVIHSYSGSADMVPVLEKYGACISFSCSITRTHNKRARKACLAVSADRLLIETDAPDIPPAGTDGINAPENLILVCREMARLRGEQEETMAQRTFENGIRIFGNR